MGRPADVACLAAEEIEKEGFDAVAPGQAASVLLRLVPFRVLFPFRAVSVEACQAGGEVGVACRARMFVK